MLQVFVLVLTPEHVLRMLQMSVSLTPDFVLSLLQMFVADSSSVLALLQRLVCLTPEFVLPLWIYPRRTPKGIA